jgi:gamma-glutamylaminecyclotransferase
MKMSKLVAVYGTLKRGYGNHRVMQMDDGIFIAEALTVLPYKMYGGVGFPRVVEELRDDDIQVRVEVFECDEVENMDRLEGHPNFFERKEIEVYVPGMDGEELMTAWMYFHPPIGSGYGELQEDGEWVGGQHYG